MLQSGKRLLVLLALGSSCLFAADEYKIDGNHSSANFSIRHNVISNVTGRFSEVSGSILYDDGDISKSSVNATIKVASINTDNAARDKHLKSPDFFDAEKFPDMTFVSKRVEKRGQDLVAIGTLTMRGVSKEIELPFSIGGKLKDKGGNEHLGVEAHMTLNRQDYGVSWSKTIEGGGLIVGNDVKIEINLEAVKAAAPKPGM